MTGEDTDQQRSYPPGVTCWIDTAQPEVDAALAFYGGLLGWQFREALPPGAPGRYVIASLDGKDLAAVGSLDADAVPCWSTYVAVDDVDATVERLQRLGAELITPPFDPGPAGRTATVADPEGAELKLWRAGRRLGSQLTNVPGAWNFSDLHSADHAAAQRFYGPGLGWVFADLGYAIAIQVPGYGDHLQSTIDPDIRVRQASAPAGFADVIGALAPLGDGEQPHWHVTFTVADRDATAASVERLGGTVLARFDTDWTRTVVVRDPQGAVFTASQFSPPVES